jgi:hypothetical protein
MTSTVGFRIIVPTAQVRAVQPRPEGKLLLRPALPSAGLSDVEADLAAQVALSMSEPRRPAKQFSLKAEFT